MHFLLMLLLAIACIPKSWPQPLSVFGWPGNPGVFAVLAWCTALALVGLAARLTVQTCWELRMRPGLRDEVLHHYARGRRFHLALLYIFIPLSVYVMGWGWAIQSLCTFETTGLLPAAELL